MNYDDFIKTLDPSQLQSLKTKIDSFLDMKPTKPVETTSVSDDLYHSILSILSSRGLRGVPMTKLAFQDRQTYQEQAASFIKYIDDFWKPKKKVERLWVYKFTLEKLALNLERRELPISVRTIICNLNIIPSVIESSFPGYARAGLLNNLLKSVFSKRSIS